ncbi:3-methyladenine DNA glycosylase [Microbacterium sp. SSW1-59]|uniref:3-methyladenine DNA glycosylase n=1 Tax=Microbacterium xanthum TaxID=3079794 RepID=UPI002AD4ABFB|nr:3-methyladenine DNA glycosylase [Microbacterium sp. SSW1-59]MDZ8201863.1 3-methyladenine DNA glycosylase [Microbacterium sp. SSW1-59]
MSAHLRLRSEQWREREAHHRALADELTADYRARAARRQKHPVEDFLFTYYSYKPSVLRRWHPGAGVVLEDAAATPRSGWRGYVPTHPEGSLVVDADLYRAQRGAMLANVVRILRATAGRAPSYGCFGMHEWAMLYREPRPRHDLPLRLGAAGTDAVVERHDLRCTHFDAYRFFTPDAAPRNRATLTRETSPEQPGCLHAGMDLYKWAVKAGPLVPGELLLDTFRHARAIRALDMQASPYDLREWGYAPVAVETPEGKAEYVRRQREFAEAGTVLRARLLDAIGV